MAEPKTFSVEGRSCGHPVYTNGGKDVLAVTGGIRDAAIAKAKKNAVKQHCPNGVEENPKVIREYKSTTDIPAHSDRFDNLMNIGEATSTGQQCYNVTLSVICVDLVAYKAKLSAPKPVAAPSQPSSPTPQLPHEGGNGEISPDMAPIGSGRKGNRANSL